MTSPLPSQNNKPQSCSTYRSIVTAIASSLLLFSRKKAFFAPSTQKTPTLDTSQTPSGSTQAMPKVRPNRKPKGVAAAKYELVDEKLKIIISKGLFKKHWVTLKEFPLYEISATEVFGNMLSVTWKDVVYWFTFKNSQSGELSKLNEQIRQLLEKHQQTIQAEVQRAERLALRKSELLLAINASLPLIDGSFDVLMGLHAKHVNWSRIEGYAPTLMVGASFSGQILSPLEVDGSRISDAIQNQDSREISKEAFDIIKVIHGYFADLKDETDLVDVSPNLEHGRMVVLAYLALNDLMLAKIVGDMDSQKEVAYLEGILQELTAQTDFKVNAEALQLSLAELGAEVDREAAVLDIRGVFREQLNQL